MKKVKEEMLEAFYPLNRRQFLQNVSAATLFAATHPHFAMGKPLLKYLTRLNNNAAPRIASLRLVTAAPLSTMKDFYHKVLGLPVLAEKHNEITIGGGQTPITFLATEPRHKEPFYHFAFNIPENKLLAARAWQQERTPLIPPYARLQDSRYPNDVVHFRSWNSHSVFFWDPGGNLLEYIARHDLKNSAPGHFTSEDILYASEIGIIVDDVRNTALELNKTFGLEQYRGGSEVFMAVGDEHGLLLVMKRGRILGFDEGKNADVFPTVATVRGKKPARYATPNFPYEIVVE